MSRCKSHVVKPKGVREVDISVGGIAKLVGKGVDIGREKEMG